MSEHAVAQQQNTNTSKRLASNAVNFQRKAISHGELAALPEWKGDTLSGGAFAEPRFGHDFSGVPAFTAVVQQTRPLHRTQLMVQRYPKDGTVDFGSCPTCPEAVSLQVSAPAEPTTETAEPASESTVLEETTAPALLVEDSTTELAPGQIRKSEFLAQLQAAVTSTAEAAMAGTGRTTTDCPYLDYWFDYYSRQDVQHGERALRRYAPETVRATTAREYIPIIAERVRRSVETWARTGEVIGIPEGMPMGLPGLGLLGGLGRLLSGIGSILFKAHEGGPMAGENPRAVQQELGHGRPLDSGVRSRMESVFGMDFSNVRTHTDTAAARLSSRLNARAFTVGEHVAFGANEYQPATPIGDALIAHELAHVVQQGGVDSSSLSSQEDASERNTLEADADTSAVGAVVSLWTQAKGIAENLRREAIPRLRSGLGIQRCASSRQTPRTPTSCAPVAAEQWTAGVRAAQAIEDVDERGAAMTQLAEQALCELRIPVQAAGNSHPRAVHPDDYQETPVLNFDVRLNEKRRWRSEHWRRQHPGQEPPPVGSNPGYNFESNDRYYAIIGPNALNEDTVLTTRAYAQHELYLTSQGAAGRDRSEEGEENTDLELEAWTRDFCNYFHQYLSLPLPQRPAWMPLVSYYDRASVDARERALQRLVEYYNNPPRSDIEPERVRRQFRRWIHRMSSRVAEDSRIQGQLFNDLQSRLDLEPSSPAPSEP